MSEDRRGIALRALRAAGHDQAADLVQAIIPEAETAETVAAAPAAPEAVVPAAETVPGPQPPPGKAPLTSWGQYEGLPQAERLERMAEADALFMRGER